MVFHCFLPFFCFRRAVLISASQQAMHSLSQLRLWHHLPLLTPQLPLRRLLLTTRLPLHSRHQKAESGAAAPPRSAQSPGHDSGRQGRSDAGTWHACRHRAHHHHQQDSLQLLGEQCGKEAGRCGSGSDDWRCQWREWRAGSQLGGE